MTASFTAAEMIRWLERMAMQFDGSWTNYGAEGEEDSRLDASMARQIAEHLREMHEE